jgi:DNA-binding transcriptional MerR regulator
LSRSTLLYYDRLGLLQPVNRTAGNYRQYSPASAERLDQICMYRSMGVPLKEIGRLLDQVRPDSSRSARILKDHLRALDREVERLQHQQRQIVRLLEPLESRLPSLKTERTTRRVRATSSRKRSTSLPEEAEMVNKERFVEIMRAAGLSDEDMHNMHRQFEKMEPDAHQEFLESLGIDSGEIEKIREWSRS